MSLSESEAVASFAPHDVVICETADGVRLLTAPPVAHFDDRVEEWCGDFTTVKGEIITIKALGRTVCYRIRSPTTESWMSCVFIADKVYDDADVAESA